MIWINVIDYRGDDTVINSRGDSLFNYRTVYFLRQQADFHHWKTAGHKFRCFTQHNDNNFSEFDDVVKIPRCHTAKARNYVLDFIQHSSEDWIGLWDNDTTLYWDRLSSKIFPRDIDIVHELAINQDIIGYVPFNPGASPYQKVEEGWTFRPTIQMKGTMMFLRNPNQYGNIRFNEQISTMDDLEWAVNLTKQDKKFAIINQVSLNELVNGKSTIFTVNAYHENYKKPGRNANPKGLLKWDAQLDRNEKYKIARKEIEQLHNLTMDDASAMQRNLWRVPKNFFDLFKFI
jgi:hypothetical protein